MRTRLIARRTTRLAVAVTCIGTGLLGAIPAAADAYAEFYGGATICGSNCFVQSPESHTFKINEGAGVPGTPKLACQLLNSKGEGEVSHGNGMCIVVYLGGSFVAARVYNQSGSSKQVGGFAET
ncbi:MAG TPA: hypothetical protein VH025_08710 [Solirubrobacteraceae bacterium]|jgi:hypothetical protein|nr:hypothetical protein [Solirubrobacteraceae bacterium]